MTNPRQAAKAEAEDNARLAEFGAQWAEMLKRVADDYYTTEERVQGRPAGQPSVAIVLKRTYDIVDHHCVVADASQQEPICSAEMAHWDEAAPNVAPVGYGNDLWAFRGLTDVVIQAEAHTYSRRKTETVVSARFGKHQREIRVFGDRHGDFPEGGTPRFSDPEPFESMPVRYDRAYGGVDHIAHLRADNPGDQFSPYHYQRNHAGVGYLIEMTPLRFHESPVPNLEYPSSPLSPENMAVGTVSNWLQGPLPAGWDWQSMFDFPRAGYGGMMNHLGEAHGPPAEVKRRWAAADILDTPPFWKSKKPPRQELFQQASPGMAVAIAPGERFELTNLHPEHKVFRFELPGEVPEVKWEVKRDEERLLTPFLCSVVVRPTANQVVVVWSARTAVDQLEAELAVRPYDVQWRSL